MIDTINIAFLLFIVILMLGASAYYCFKSEDYVKRTFGSILGLLTKKGVNKQSICNL